MMKQIFKTLAGILAATSIVFFMASCKKEFFDGDPEQMSRIGVERAINVSAIMPQGGDKAYLDYADGRKVKWELTDALNINGTNLALSSLYADPTKAQFEGTTYAIASGSNEIYWAVYPTTLTGAASGSSIPSNFTASTLTVNFPTTQTYNSSADALSGNTYMAGYASVPTGTGNLVFQMRNIGTVLKLNLKADASATNKLASRIEFSTTNGALAGDFTVNNNTTNPTVAPAANATKTLTVNLTDGTNDYIDLTIPRDIYVILPPLASKNLTMTVVNTDNKRTNKTMSSATMERNKIYTNTISDLCFCECGGGLPYFSISATKQVVFAPGNLQWSATNGGSLATTHRVAGGGTAAGTWRFAANQWDYIGNAAGNNTAVASRATQAAWIDLFGWGTSGYHDASDANNMYYYPYSSSQNITGYPNNEYGYGPSTTSTNPNIAGTNYDWGVYNAIYNPKTGNTDPAGTWRTPTKDEWEYVLNTRTTCSGVRYAKATVNSVCGLILVPDNWDINTYALAGTNTASAAYTTNDGISSTQWTNIFEAAGCVFLPAAGFRTGISITDVNSIGRYWASTYINYQYAYSMQIRPAEIRPAHDDGFRFNGRSVRLVKEVE